MKDTVVGPVSMEPQLPTGGAPIDPPGWQEVA